MSLIKRISTTFTASIGNVVTRVENHDAIIDASLKECRQAAARAKVQLKRVQKDTAQLTDKQQRTRKDIELWQQRAIEAATKDEAKALQCLKRKQQLESVIDQLAASRAQQQDAERSISENLKQIEHRITQVSQQRNAFKSRQAASEATKVLAQFDSDRTPCIEDTFERWESKLMEAELSTNCDTNFDPLESEFLQQEETASLKLELENLMQQKGEQ